MMWKRPIYLIGFLVLLLTISTAIPANATNWGDPLLTDPLGDELEYGEDIQSVDARYVDNFVYFRFKMNAFIMDSMLYYVGVDFDKNTTSGDTTSWPDSDIGIDFWIACEISVSTDIFVGLTRIIPGELGLTLIFNMTANNGTLISCFAGDCLSYFQMVLLSNSSQGEVVFGVNWTWIIDGMAVRGVEGDNCSMYLEYVAGWDTDWCPDRTNETTDYIEWNLCTDTRGIPGFSTCLVFVCLLGVLTAIMLLDRKKIKL